jgi:hypothetical protein
VSRKLPLIRSHSINQSTGKPTLLPFLAVLLCTMGALIMLLVLIARDIREPELAGKSEQNLTESESKLTESEQKLTANPPEELAQQKSSDPKTDSQDNTKIKIPANEAKETIDKIKLDIEEADWFAKQFSESKADLDKKLADEQAYLASVEKETQRLREEVKRLFELANEIDKSEQTKTDVGALQKLLDEKAKEKDASEKRLAELQKELKDNAKSYAIVPYRGKNGTFRHPIYVECRYDKVIFQPEGIELVPQDFLTADRADNPFDSLLRVVRQYYVETGQAERGAEPYPLIVVRPSGIHAYEAAQNAMGSWLKDYGYELVEEDWKMVYPNPNEELGNRLRKQLEISRQRLQGYIATMNMKNNTARAKRIAEAHRNADDDSKNTAGRHRGGFEQNMRNTGAEDKKYTVSNGVTKLISNPLIGDLVSDAYEKANDNTRNNTNKYQGGFEQKPKSAATVWTESLGNSVWNRDKEQSINVVQRNINTPQSSSPSPDLSKPNDNIASEYKAGGERNDIFAQSNETDDIKKFQTAGKLMTEPIASAGKIDRAKESGVNSAPNNVSSSGSGSPLTSLSSPPSMASPQASASINSAPHESAKQQQMSVNDFGLMSTKPFSSPIRRVIKLQVTSDRFIIVRQAGLDVPKVVLIERSVRHTLNSLVPAIGEFMDTWGIAGEKFYWQPALQVEVLNGGEQNFKELQFLLKDTKIVIERK